MARIKKSVDYFPHFIGGKKMRYIRKKFGNDGYAAWFIILEELATSDDHHVYLNEIDFLLLSDDCGVEPETLEAIITELVKIGQIHKELWEKAKVLYCQQLRDSLVYAYVKRKTELITTVELEQKYLGVKPVLEKKEKLEDETEMVITVEQTSDNPNVAPPSSTIINLHDLVIYQKTEFRNYLEKDTLFIQNQCLINRIKERIFWEKLKIFILQIEGEGNLLNRKYTALRNYFQNWIRIHLNHERRNKKDTGGHFTKRHQSGGAKIIDPSKYKVKGERRPINLEAIKAAESRLAKAETG